MKKILQFLGLGVLFICGVLYAIDPQFLVDHKDVSKNYIHHPYNYEYTDTTNRINRTGFSAKSIGKLAFQTNDKTLWMLINTSGGSNAWKK